MVSNANSFAPAEAQLAAVSNSDGNWPAIVPAFDPSSEASWCELFREIVAAANAGGGLVHVEPDTAIDVAAGQALVSAEAIVGGLSQFIDSRFERISVRAPASTNGAVEVVVGPAEFPIGFHRSAPTSSMHRLASAEEPAFAVGKFYFRRGRQTVAGTSTDLRAFFLRKLRQLQHQWIRDIRSVLSRSVDSISGNGKAWDEGMIDEGEDRNENLQPVRIVDDPSAPALQPQHVDRLYPWRQRDLVDELNRRLGRRGLTTYDVQAVRRQHELDARPEFVFHLPGAGRRYSPAVADWIMGQFALDAEFFQNAHAADQAMLRMRRQKPR